MTDRMPDFVKACQNTEALNRDFTRTLDILGPDPNNWPLSVREYAVQLLLARLDEDE